jgi:hypothetical protein
MFAGLADAEGLLTHESAAAEFASGVFRRAVARPARHAAPSQTRSRRRRRPGGGRAEPRPLTRRRHASRSRRLLPPDRATAPPARRDRTSVTHRAKNPRRIARQKRQKPGVRLSGTPRRLILEATTASVWAAFWSDWPIPELFAAREPPYIRAGCCGDRCGRPGTERPPRGDALL